MLQVSASIIQGSAIGPVSYDINASDRSTVTPVQVCWRYLFGNSHQQRSVQRNQAVAEWDQRNNLKLNRGKTAKIIFRDRKRKRENQDPPMLSDIRRDSQIKILGVTLTNHLSISEHVREVIGKCGQTMYVLKVLRSHGLNDAALKDIYKSVVLAKLLYASPAWWGFATESDKHRIEAFVRHGVRLQLYGATDPTPTQLAEEADKTLFGSITRNQQHDLNCLLLEPICHQ